MLPPIKSESKTLVTGGRISFHDWVPLRGPRGGRVIIDGFEIVFDGSATTTTAALLGEDRPRIFGLTQVLTRRNILRWNLLGDQSRIAAFLLDGADRVKEHADTGVGAAQVIDAEQYLPMTKRFARRPYDFGLAVDDFKEVVVTMPTNADLSLGTSVVTAAAGTYYVLAHCHEEFAVEAKMHDEVAATDFTSTTEGRISLRGKLTDLALHARGAAGGLVLTNMPTVRIDELDMPPLSRTPDLLNVYSRMRNIVPGLSSTQGGEMRTDPFRADFACAVMLSDGDGRDSNVDFKVRDSAKVTCDGNTVAGLVAIHRQVLPQSAEYLAELSARWDIPPDEWRVKTDGKTKRDPKSWKPGQLPWLPKSARLRMAA